MLAVRVLLKDRRSHYCSFPTFAVFRSEPYLLLYLWMLIYVFSQRVFRNGYTRDRQGVVSSCFVVILKIQFQVVWRRSTSIAKCRLSFIVHVVENTVLVKILNYPSTFRSRFESIFVVFVFRNSRNRNFTKVTCSRRGRFSTLPVGFGHT